MKSLTRFFLVGLLFALLSGVAFGQNLCSSTVSDDAGVLGNQLSSVQNAASALVNAGADPHIITVSSITGGTIDATILNDAKSCPEWQTADHRNVKSNLFVIAVAPTQRKMAVFPGTAYEKAFNAAQVSSIRTDFMAPAFKKGEWAQGLIAAARQSATQITAFNNKATTPVQSTTNNITNTAPTDFHGLWVFLWILGGIGLIVVIVLIARAISAAKQEKLNAQADAIAARNRAADLVSSLSSALAGADATQSNVKYAQSLFDTYSASYTRLAGNLSSDPTDDSLTLETYQSLESQYQTIGDKLTTAQRYLNSRPEEPSAYNPSVGNSSASGATNSGSPASGSSRKHGKHSHSHTTIIRETVVPAPASNNDFATGLVLGEALESNRRNDEYERPSRRSSSDDAPSFSSSSSSSGFESSSRSSDDDSSSSRSSDDSSSSSDYSSSSSSSDFGSSSSDFSSSSGSSDF